MSQIHKLKASLPENMDAAMITSPVNRRYYTGFPSSAGTLIVTRETSWLIIDSRYYGAASRQARVDEVLLQETFAYRQLEKLFAGKRLRRIGIESRATTLAELARLREKLPKVSFADDNGLSDLINAHRMVKTPGEIANIREAQRMTDEAFAYIAGLIKPGMSEQEIALELEFRSRRNGSEEAAFPFIVAAGANSSYPHAVPGDYRVRRGDLITMDFGCTVGGYRSDMTRTVAAGMPGGKQAEVYALVLRAQLAGLEAIRAGVTCSEVDKAARDIIDATPYQGLFGHGLGHSLGLEIHEAPRFSRLCEDTLPEGCVMSVEPGVYIDGEFGVRIEDIVVSTKDGCENLTKSPKELLIL